MVLEITIFWHFFSAWMHQILKRWTKPIAKPVIVGALSDLRRNRTDLIMENAILRQQLIVLTRQIKRLQLTHGDCLGLVFLARFTKFWKQALHIAEQIRSYAGIEISSVSTGNASQSLKRRNLEYHLKPFT